MSVLLAGAAMVQPSHSKGPCVEPGKTAEEDVLPAACPYI